MIIYMIYLIHYISIHHIILLYTIYSILYTSTITLYHILHTHYILHTISYILNTTYYVLILYTTARGPEEPGGIITKEAPVHLSNVSLLDPVQQVPTRMRP